MKTLSIIFASSLVWLITSASLLAVTHAAPAITPDFVVKWLSAKGFTQGGSVQMCDGTSSECPLYHIERLSVASDGDAIVVRITPRRMQ